VNRADYVRQVVAVSDFIYEHLDEDLDLYRLAEVAHESPFHWHRIYRAMCGEAAAATVRRLRLQRAADALAGTTLPVREVAARSGFASVEVFSRNFSAVYAMPPARYRSTGAHMQFRAAPAEPSAAATPAASIGGITMVDFATERAGASSGSTGAPAPATRHPGAIRQIEARSVAASAHTRPESWWPTTSPCLQRSSASNSPRATTPCSARGPYASMHAPYTWLCGSWLPSSGRTPGDHPVVEEYLTDPATTAPHDLRTDILLLLE
jgi:AraC family transcriptional regulator